MRLMHTTGACIPLFYLAFQSQAQVACYQHVTRHPPLPPVKGTKVGSTGLLNAVWYGPGAGQQLTPGPARPRTRWNATAQPGTPSGTPHPPAPRPVQVSLFWKIGHGACMYLGTMVPLH